MVKKNTINNKSDPLDATNVTINSAYTLPNADGTADQALTTDGAGNIAFEDVGGGSALTWNEITVDTTAAVNNAYICNAASEITVTLPATFTINDRVKIMGKNTGGWTVKAATGDTIYHLDQVEYAPDPFFITEVRGCVDIQGITDDSTWEIINLEGTLVSGDISAINAGYSSSFFLKTSGNTKTCGLGTSGQLGNNSITNVSIPVYPVGGHIFDIISGGVKIKAALKADGSAWSWGDNAYGQLGDETVISKSSPVSVVGGHSFIDISAGNGYTAALKADGSVWSWGINTYGGLGDNSVVSKSSPVSVVGGHSFTSISSIINNAMALKADGSAWTWGYNGNGGLGDNTIVHKSSPVAVTGGYSFIDVDVFENGSIAIRDDNTAWTWGRNNYGQLGDGTTVGKSSPSAVTGGHSFVKVDGGGYTCLALKADGTAWTWGRNDSGELGDGTSGAVARKSSPVAVTGGHSFTDITAGKYYDIALKADGSVWAWGLNTSGELGDGTTVSTSSPIQVLNL